MTEQALERQDTPVANDTPLPPSMATIESYDPASWQSSFERLSKTDPTPENGLTVTDIKTLFNDTKNVSDRDANFAKALEENFKAVAGLDGDSKTISAKDIAKLTEQVASSDGDSSSISSKDQANVIFNKNVGDAAVKVYGSVLNATSDMLDRKSVDLPRTASDKEYIDALDEKLKDIIPGWQGSRSFREIKAMIRRGGKGENGAGPDAPSSSDGEAPVRRNGQGKAGADPVSPVGSSSEAPIRRGEQGKEGAGTDATGSSDRQAPRKRGGQGKAGAGTDATSSSDRQAPRKRGGQGKGGGGL